VSGRLVDPRRWALASQVFALQVAVAAIVLAGGLAAAFVQARAATEEKGRQRVLAVAHTLATDPVVLEAGSEPRPTDLLQPYAELRTGSVSSLPKGFSEDLWVRVLETVRGADQGLSANEVAGRLGVSRVTARRCLEHLADRAMAVRRAGHAGAARPELKYRWTGR